MTRHVLRLLLVPETDAPARARSAVSTLVGASGDASSLFALQVVASELVKNAVIYGSKAGRIRFEVALDGGLAEIRVTNSGRRIRMRGLRTHRRKGGRGLEIIDALASGWSIESGPHGTTFCVKMTLVDTDESQAPGRGFAAVETGYRRGMSSRKGRSVVPRAVHQNVLGTTSG